MPVVPVLPVVAVVLEEGLKHDSGTIRVVERAASPCFSGKSVSVNLIAIGSVLFNCVESHESCQSVPS